MKFLITYGKKLVTLDELHEWSEWKALDPSVQVSAEWLLVESTLVGKPLGIGDIVRDEATQLRGALARHHVSAPGEKPCCMHDGIRYTKNPNVAHMTFPPNSFHLRQPTNNTSKAIDWFGNLPWLEANCGRVGLRTFKNVNGEPWHTQPVSIPTGVQAYLRNLPKYGKIPMPTLPPHTGSAPQTPVVEAPRPVLRYGFANNVQEVREWQAMCNFFKWTDAAGKPLLVDGNFGRKTEQATGTAQKALGFIGDFVDGIYGKMTAARVQSFITNGKV